MNKATQTIHNLHPSTTSQQTIALSYLVYLPPEYDAQQGKHWPLVLFMHGASMRGNNIHLVKRQGLARLVDAGQDFPFILVSPQCPMSQWWTWPQMQETLAHLLDEIESSYAVDPDRIYVTGLSMGGYGTWSLASNYPDRFAAIVPICGPAENLEQLRAITHLPVRAFHGDQDMIIPLPKMIETVHALQAYGGNVALTIYHGVGHDAATPAYAEPALYDWLLQQRKSNTIARAEKVQ